MNVITSEKTKLKAKRAFIKNGTCSRTFFFLLNREFGHLKEDEERAIDPLAGGILQQGSNVECYGVHQWLLVQKLLEEITTWTRQ